MRQVPFSPHTLIVGDGKMATHFGHYLSLLGLNYSQWSRKKSSPELLPELFNQADLTVLLISDGQLKRFIHQHDFLKTKLLVHFSGALSIDDVSSAHPLMSFTEKRYDLELYKKIPFIIEKGKSNPLSFLPNPFYEIPSELKPYYHMLCVLSGNFTCTLWQKFFNELENKFNLPQSIGELYLKQITQNIIQNPNAALTGPLVRGDHLTIQKHLDVLKADDFENVYKAFVGLFEQGEEHEYS